MLFTRSAKSIVAVFLGWVEFRFSLVAITSRGVVRRLGQVWLDAAKPLFLCQKHRIHGSAAPPDPAGMAQTVNVLLRPDNRALLTAVLDDRNRPQKHVQRARYVLLSADRLSGPGAWLLPSAQGRRRV